jgi:hypothetical protein
MDWNEKTIKGSNKEYKVYTKAFFLNDLSTTDGRIHQYKLPAFFIHPTKGVMEIEKVPYSVVTGTALSKFLQVSQHTIIRWRKKGIIEFAEGKKYDVKEVVDNLLKYGYKKAE